MACAPPAVESVVCGIVAPICTPLRSWHAQLGIFRIYKLVVVIGGDICSLISNDNSSEAIEHALQIVGQSCSQFMCIKKSWYSEK